MHKRWTLEAGYKGMTAPIKPSYVVKIRILFLMITIIIFIDITTKTTYTAPVFKVILPQVDSESGSGVPSFNAQTMSVRFFLPRLHI